MVPGVGRRMSREFREYRPYRGMAEFRREIGKYVDDAEVARLEQYVFVPIKLNRASDRALAHGPRALTTGSSRRSRSPVPSPAWGTFEAASAPMPPRARWPAWNAT